MEEIQAKEQLGLMNTSFGDRMMAYLIDILPIIFLNSILVYFLFGWNIFADDASMIAYGDEFVPEAKISRVYVRYLSLVVWIIYCTFMDASRFQGSFGKALVDIKVCNADGMPLEFMESLTRNVTKIISYIPLGLGFLWCLFHKKRKTWHDMISRTYVIKKK